MTALVSTSMRVRHLLQPLCCSSCFGQDILSLRRKQVRKEGYGLGIRIKTVTGGSKAEIVENGAGESCSTEIEGGKLRDIGTGSRERAAENIGE